MDTTIIITTLFIIIFVIEMFHDDVHRRIRNNALNNIRLMSKNIEGYNPSFDRAVSEDLSDEWHTLDWMSWVAIAGLVTILDFFLHNSWWSIATLFLIGSLRVIILTIINNIRLRQEWSYLGLGRFGKIFEGKEAFICVLTILVFIGSFLIGILT